MNQVELARVLTIIAKSNIDNNPQLTREEKEFLKHWVDKAKEEIENSNRRGF